MKTRTVLVEDVEQRVTANELRLALCRLAGGAQPNDYGVARVTSARSQLACELTRTRDTRRGGRVQIVGCGTTLVLECRRMRRGARYYVRCPECNKRVVTLFRLGLYGPPRCRVCLSLRYRSESLSPQRRVAHRLAKIDESLQRASGRRRMALLRSKRILERRRQELRLLRARQLLAAK